jgi:iron complex transport system permease protein
MNQTRSYRHPALPSPSNARTRRIRRKVLVCLLLVMLACSLLYVDITFGTVLYSFNDLWRVISGEWIPGISFALGELRIPRSLTALACGATFRSGWFVFPASAAQPAGQPLTSSASPPGQIRRRCSASSFSDCRGLN